MAFASDAGERLTFKRALELAAENNPAMIEAQQALKAAEGERLTARTLPNPEVEFEIGRDTHLDAIAVVQPIGSVGAHFFESRIAANEVRIQEESVRAAWTGVYLQIRDHYSEIILNKKRVELARQNLDTLRHFYSHVQDRYQSGQAFKNDYQRAKIEMLGGESDYLSAEKDLKTAQARLNLLLGRPIETAFDVVEDLTEEKLTKTYEELKALALTGRPDVSMAELELDSKKKNVIKEELSRLPSWSIGFQRTDEDYEDDYSVLVGFEIPIWNLNQGEVTKARAERTSQEARTAAVRNAAAFDVYDSYLTAELHQKQLDLTKSSLQEANELLRLANLRYSEGKIDFLNYLDQTQTAGEAKVAYYQALFDLNRSISVLEIAIYASLNEEKEFLK